MFVLPFCIERPFSDEEKNCFFDIDSIHYFSGYGRSKKSEYAQKVIDRLQEVVEQYGKDNLPYVPKMNAMLRDDLRIFELQKTAIPLFAPKEEPSWFFKYGSTNQRAFFHYAALQAHSQKKYYVAAVLDGYDPTRNETRFIMAKDMVLIASCCIAAGFFVYMFKNL